MLVYAAMTICAVAGCLWAKVSRDKLKDCSSGISFRYKRNLAIGLLLSFLPLFGISAFRWNVGTDTWHTYTPEYLAMKAERTTITEEEQQIILECGKLYTRWDFGYSKEKTDQLTYQEVLAMFQRNSRHTAIGFQALEKFLLLFNADVQWLYILTSVIILAFCYAAIWKQSSMHVISG